MIDEPCVNFTKDVGVLICVFYAFIQYHWVKVQIFLSLYSLLGMEDGPGVCLVCVCVCMCVTVVGGGWRIVRGREGILGYWRYGRGGWVNFYGLYGFICKERKEMWRCVCVRVLVCVINEGRRCDARVGYMSVNISICCFWKSWKSPIDDGGRVRGFKCALATAINLRSVCRSANFN